MESLIEDKLETIYTSDLIFNVEYVGKGTEKVYKIFVMMRIGHQYDFEFKYKFDDYFTLDWNIQRIRKIIDVNLLKTFVKF